jgi:hypothetical protein
MNLTAKLSAKRDAYTKGVGAFILPDAFVRMAQSDVAGFLAKVGARFLRIIYRCKDGVVRDVIGRQGVHQSAQDGVVTGEGHAMRRDGVTIGLWTNVGKGPAVNTGAGFGYRTLRIEGILAMRVEGVTILTDRGAEALRG